MTEDALPGFFHDAEREAARAQYQTLWWSRIRLGGALLAALGGALTWKVDGFEVWAAVAVAGFCLALVTELLLAFKRPERQWYSARAVAESLKSLSWRFAVAGFPFDGADARALLRERARGIVTRYEGLHLTAENPYVTERMLTLRAAPFAERKSAYLQCRVLDQKDWYSRNARKNEDRVNQWRAVLIAGEMVAIVLAGCRAFGVWDADWSGVLAALVAGGAAWIGLKRHSSLATTYSLAARDLALIHASLVEAGEETWPAAVAEVEETIGREHALWLATRPADQ
ncbi:DUF4231 domain-containing protein [Saccharothrix violaceirubra]|uniref:DUF4231 domain-containing protein n=1 Tax=Saccharothrix violaceirubra TaxID=413306 RepID=A0A7W7WX14_9PSEU|nr:DUF4231 domain-containing protein [Saccharothrix violaceirubra]MBB4966964.1 hypothetical protein [Saccharothrix violaceirubra]